MDVIELIGFVIAMVAMVFLIIRRTMEERRKRTHPEEMQEEEHHPQANLKQLLKALDIDIEEEEEEEEIPRPKPKHIAKKQVEPPPLKIGYIKPKVRNLAEGYHAIVKEKPSRANKIINQLPSRKNMIICQEIMNPPVGFRTSNFTKYR